MTEATITARIAPDLSLQGADVPPRTLFKQVLASVLARLGARLGLAWVALLVVSAAFAPVLANTHPLLMKRGGRISIPFLRHLSAGDVVLQAAFWAGFVLYLLPRIAARMKILIFIGIVLVTGIVTWFAVRPPELVIYEQY